MIYDFLWNGKKPLVAKDTLKRNKESRGLRLYDISDLQLAQNVKMIYKIIHEPEQMWNIIGKYYLKMLDSNLNQKYFLCQITCFERVKLLKEIPKFYNLSLKNWSAFL